MSAPEVVGLDQGEGGHVGRDIHLLLLLWVAMNVSELFRAKEETLGEIYTYY